MCSTSNSLLPPTARSKAQSHPPAKHFAAILVGHHKNARNHLIDHSSCRSPSTLSCFLGGWRLRRLHPRARYSTTVSVGVTPSCCTVMYVLMPCAHYDIFCLTVSRRLSAHQLLSRLSVNHPSRGACTALLSERTPFRFWSHCLRNLRKGFLRVQVECSCLSASCSVTYLQSWPGYSWSTLFKVHFGQASRRTS